MSLAKDDVEKIAHLARLALGEDELDSVADGLLASSRWWNKWVLWIPKVLPLWPIRCT